MRHLKINFDYLAAPQEAHKLKVDDHYIKTGQGYEAYRKIFHSVPLDNFEEEQLGDFTSFINKAGLRLPQDWTDRDSLRFLYSCRFDQQRALNKVTKYSMWREDLEATPLSPESMHYLESGAMYYYGRDHMYRPVIVIDFGKVDVEDVQAAPEFCKALGVLCLIVQKYAFVPGKVENWVTIIDTANKALNTFPYHIFKPAIALMTAVFTNTMEKTFILNATQSLKSSWKLLSTFVDDNTASRIEFVEATALLRLQDNIPDSQLEKRFGGRLENLTRFWPPQTTDGTAPIITPDVKYEAPKANNTPTQITRSTIANPVSTKPQSIQNSSPSKMIWDSQYNPRQVDYHPERISESQEFLNLNRNPQPVRATTDARFALDPEYDPSPLKGKNLNLKYSRPQPYYEDRMPVHQPEPERIERVERQQERPERQVRKAPVAKLVESQHIQIEPEQPYRSEPNDHEDDYHNKIDFDKPLSSDEEESYDINQRVQLVNLILKEHSDIKTGVPRPEPEDNFFGGLARGSKKESNLNTGNSPKSGYRNGSAYNGEWNSGNDSKRNNLSGPYNERGNNFSGAYNEIGGQRQRPITPKSKGSRGGTPKSRNENDDDDEGFFNFCVSRGK